MDRDGDVDALSASLNDDTIAWYENDGTGTTWTLHTISTSADGAYSVFAADVDGDGDVEQRNERPRDVAKHGAAHFWMGMIGKTAQPPQKESANNSKSRQRH